ncbi:penicillin-binding protein 2 [Candidatus Berkelbacteria bacterium]|nr:penicillin-binding protein 2 [Candidatus Berkelbacteria bacterium]
MSIFEPGGTFGFLRRSGAEFNWVLDEPAAEEPASWHRVGLGHLILMVLVTASLVVRLLFLQVSQATDNQLLAAGNRIRNRLIEPPRGLIVDRNGVVIAKNAAEFAVELTPADLPREQPLRQAVYDAVATLLTYDRARLIAEVEAEGLFSLHPLILAEHLSHEQSIVLKVLLQDLPGVRVINRARREYERAPGLAHLLGYTGQSSDPALLTKPGYSAVSRVGRAGVEATYEAVVRGSSGVEQVEVDSRGHLERIIGQQPPVAGETLALTVDLEFQRVLGERLARAIEEAKARAGVAVALDPRDGGIVAMVSLPDYDNNEFSLGLSEERYAALLADERDIFTNRAIAGVYPSGSVIKPVVAAAGLADGRISADTTIDAPAQIEIGEFIFPDWKRHGLTDVRKALAVSSNVFFYAVGGGWDKIHGLGAERLGHYLELFGFGRVSGIDLGGEVAGLVPSPEWKQAVKGEPWYLGDTYHLAIGQGDLLVTPLQVANAIGSIANGGRLLEPHLVRATLPAESDPADVARADSVPPTVTNDALVAPAVLQVVREGMRQAVESGSARPLQALPVTAAAKTGTAQFSTAEATHAWFSAFAPYENPELVLAILIEGGGAGNEVALPVALDALAWYFRPAT